jgi:hypothetical protein
MRVDPAFADARVLRSVMPGFLAGIEAPHDEQHDTPKQRPARARWDAQPKRGAAAPS